MVCSTCGYEQFAGAQFCGRCGAKMEGAPGPAGDANPQAWMPGSAMPAPAMPIPGAPYYRMAMPAAPRVRHHLQPLGILWIVFGVYRIVATVVAAVAFHALERNGMFGDVPPFLHDLAGGLLPALALLVGAIAILTIATGWALLTRRAWGRTLAIVMGVLALFKIPLGTALGIYTLWVLAPRASGVEWDVLAAEAEAARPA